MSAISSYLIFVALIVLFLLAVNSISGSASKEQKRSLENALMRGAAQCYAMEGRYPISLDYLKQNYNVVYDESTFFVGYTPTAENLPPDIMVISIGGDR